MIELFRKPRKVVQSIAGTLLANDVKASAVGYAVILFAIVLIALIVG